MIHVRFKQKLPDGLARTRDNIALADPGMPMEHVVYAAKLAGDLVTVSKDAANDEKFGLVYPSRVRLVKTHGRIDAKDIELSPGMAVTVEIKAGQRRLIEYFLSPLIQAARER